MEKRCKRGALAPHLHIRAPKIPDHSPPQSLRKGLPVTNLQRAPAPRLMRKGLTVKPNDLRALEPAQNRCMGALDNLGRGLNLRPRPFPKGRGQNRPLLRLIGAIAALTKGKNRLAICLNKGRIHPIKRSPRHRPKRPYPFFTQSGPIHGLFLCLFAAYTRLRK